MEEALKVWSDAADLEFLRVEDGVAHIDIQFGRGDHGDDDPFDGRGGQISALYQCLICFFSRGNLGSRLLPTVWRRYPL